VTGGMQQELVVAVAQEFANRRRPFDDGPYAAS